MSTKSARVIPHYYGYVQDRFGRTLRVILTKGKLHWLTNNGVKFNFDGSCASGHEWNSKLILSTITAIVGDYQDLSDYKHEGIVKTFRGYEKKVKFRATLKFWIAPNGRKFRKSDGQDATWKPNKYIQSYPDILDLESIKAIQPNN